MASQAFTLADIRTDLAALYGENTAPTDSTRDSYINFIIRDIYYRRLWRWRRTTANLTFTSGASDSPTAFAPDNLVATTRDGWKSNMVLKEVVSGDDNDIYYTQIDPIDSENYTSTDTVYWVTGSEYAGYTFNIPSTDSKTLQLTYYRSHETLSSSTDKCYVPSLNAVVRGAYALLVKNDDIDRNNQSELTDYEIEVSKMSALDGASTARQYRSISAESGHYIGRT
jgi:hypothetical protein